MGLGQNQIEIELESDNSRLIILETSVGRIYPMGEILKYDK